MKKVVLTFGLISGALSSLMMLATLPLEDKIGFDKALILGYAIIVASFLLVFFGIRSYRDNASNGRITFAKAFVVGISITLVTCIFYVGTWEIMYFNFMPDFMTKYGARELERARAAGASPAAIQAKIQEIQHAKQIYDNPIYNAAQTFLEPFPVGLLITLLSAAVLRRKTPPQPA